MATSTENAPRNRSLLPAILLATLVFTGDVLLVNVVSFSAVVVVFNVAVSLPLSFLKRYRSRRRHVYRTLAIYLGTLALVVVMVEVNEHVAPLRAQRLVDAIESYRAATGIYPKKLDDLVPDHIDRVPCAQYTLGGVFYYFHGGTEEPPIFFCNPHFMDHRGYDFKTKKWTYLG
jgi:hypothetical protein